jgi:hypothetical protein
MYNQKAQMVKQWEMGLVTSKEIELAMKLFRRENLR